MKRAKTLGLAATVAAVLVLGGSLVLGIRGEPLPDGPHPTAGAPEPPRPPEERVRVEVLNASGVAGAAREATRILRDRGFDVVYFGNARGFAPDSSLVLDRLGTGEHAEAVGEALEIERVRSRPDPTRYLEVTVVIGKDWTGPAPGS
ncbi:MAG: LytR C-terminal domain-containing protein [Gemmatimonadota bacterium]|nr:LytR C-terminal domain-containing protein [Gemmatimonadota bacterium]